MYIVLRPFDFYRKWDVMPEEDVADQMRRGNMPDLIRNGFIREESDDVNVEELTQEEEVVVLDDLSDDDLRTMAKDAGIPHYWSKKRETLIEELADNDDN